MTSIEKRKRNREKPRFNKAKAVYIGFIEREETPPGPTELAKLAGVDKATACRATAWWQAKFTAIARDDARERFVDTCND